MDDKAREILFSLADNLTELILKKLGKEYVEAILLAGSAAEGRVASFDDQGFIEIYSDLDFYVIVSPSVDLEKARTEARSLAVGLELDTPLFKIFRHPDIGVYTREDLLAQPRRPATVEMHSCFRMLYERAQFAVEVEQFPASAIPKHEALYLLENRLIEQGSLNAVLSAGTSDGYKRFAYYTSLKHCLDVVSAALIFEGKYECGLENRLDRFWDATGTAWHLFNEKQLELIGYAQKKMANLQEAMSEEAIDFHDIRFRSEELLLEGWKNFCAGLFKKAPLVGWDKLIAMRCEGDSPLDNLREAVVISRKVGRGVPAGFSIWSKGVNRKPLCVLRLSGLCEILFLHQQSVEVGLCKEVLGYLERMTKILGFSAGSVCNRARALYKSIS